MELARLETQELSDIIPSATLQRSTTKSLLTRMNTLSQKLKAKKFLQKKTSLDMMMSEENSIDEDSSHGRKSAAGGEDINRSNALAMEPRRMNSSDQSGVSKGTPDKRGITISDVDGSSSNLNHQQHTKRSSNSKSRFRQRLSNRVDSAKKDKTADFKSLSARLDNLDAKFE